MDNKKITVVTEDIRLPHKAKISKCICIGTATVKILSASAHITGSTGLQLQLCGERGREENCHFPLPGEGHLRGLIFFFFNYSYSLSFFILYY